MSELFPYVTTFVLLHLGRKFVQDNLNLALDVINNISKHFRAILPLKMLLNDRKRQLVMKFFMIC